MIPGRPTDHMYVRLSVCPSSGSQEKLSLCSSYGADVTIDYKSQDFSEVVLRETSGKGGWLAIGYAPERMCMCWWCDDWEWCVVMGKEPSYCQ